MKTNVRNSSIEAYYDDRRCGRAGSVRRKIFDYVRNCKGNVSRQDIEKALDIKINVVCGRVNELIENGALKVRYTEPSAGGRGPREMLSVAMPQLSLLDGKPGNPYSEVRR